MMTTARPGRLLWLAIVALALAAIGAGLWYAYQQGGVQAVYTWAHHRLMGRAGEESGDMRGMNMRGMNMHGMNMGSKAEASDVPDHGTDMHGMNMGSKAEASDVADHAVVILPGNVQQRLGVTVGTVEEGPLSMTVRTVGIVQPNETKVSHVHLKTEGWVKEVFVDYTGRKVKKGEPLLSIYSPQFVATQQEYLNAYKGEQTELARLARQRLELWDVPADEISELARRRPT